MAAKRTPVESRITKRAMVGQRGGKVIIRETVEYDWEMSPAEARKLADGLLMAAAAADAAGKPAKKGAKC